jgi:hypothetical protein
MSSIAAVLGFAVLSTNDGFLRSHSIAEAFFCGVSIAAILKPTDFEPILVQRGEFGQYETLLL